MACVQRLRFACLFHLKVTSVYFTSRLLRLISPQGYFVLFHQTRNVLLMKRVISFFFFSFFLGGSCGVVTFRGVSGRY